MLNGVGDIIDLNRALYPESRPDVSKLNYQEFQAVLLKIFELDRVIKMSFRKCSPSENNELS